MKRLPLKSLIPKSDWLPYNHTRQPKTQSLRNHPTHVFRIKKPIFQKKHKKELAFLGASSF